MNNQMKKSHEFYTHSREKVSGICNQKYYKSSSNCMSRSRLPHSLENRLTDGGEVK
jgi:hypothetical protein